MYVDCHSTMQPTWKYVALGRSMKPLQLILIREENSQVWRQGHMNKTMVNNFDTGCMYMGSQIVNCLF